MVTPFLFGLMLGILWPVYVSFFRRKGKGKADYKGPGEVQKPEQLPMPPPPLYGRNGPPPPKDPNRKTNPPSPPPPPKRNYHYVDVTVRHIQD